MLLAMMSLQVFPLINEYSLREERKPQMYHSHHFVVFLIAGAMTSWILFGIAVYSLDLGVHKNLAGISLTQGNIWIIIIMAPMLVCMLVGMHQLSGERALRKRRHTQSRY